VQLPKNASPIKFPLGLDIVNEASIPTQKPAHIGQDSILAINIDLLLIQATGGLKSAENTIPLTAPKTTKLHTINLTNSLIVYT
jgi:hypothetical protein